MDGDAAAEAVEVGGGTCGICLADARRAIRGELDCCGHRFCFVCIMAWARVESRCPFCKARFRTIRRPPVPGRFPSARIVTVAERNQVYHPLGNESSTVNTDPYADTSCSVCSCSRDEELLLLCELCDSAAHTYCVGLGTTIPEGDWFCADCTTSKEEHSRCQIDDGRSGQRGELQICIELPRDDSVAAPSVTDFVDEDYYSQSSVQLTSAQSSRPPIVDPIPSIYDIVDEDYTTIPVHRTNSRSNRLDRNAESSSAGSQCPESPRERDNGRVSLHANARFEVERARTLHNSRNLSNRIRALRENWPALRAGSVGFAMQLPNHRRKNGSGTISVAEQHQGATHIVNNSQNGAGTSNIEQHQQSATAFTEETTTSSGHANKISPKDGRDVRKAWKMLDMAKSAGGKRKAHKPSSLDCSPAFSMGNRLIASSSSPIDTILGHNNNNLFNEITQKNNVECNLSTKMENTPPTKNFQDCHNLPENCRHVSGHGRKPPGIVNQDSFNGKGQTLESLCGTSRSEKPKSDILRPFTCNLPSGQSTTSSIVQLKPRARRQPVKMANPEEHSVFATTNYIGTAEANKMRSSGPNHHKRKRKLDYETHDDQGSKRSKSCCKIAKTEISSLAIRELKLLKIDKTYGSDRFKEVARAATHAVLASCGLEHSPSLAHALPRPICRHNWVSKHLKSPALSNFCSECLCSFVKEVISSMLPGVKMEQTAASC